jgi:hypothetical protein
LLYGKAVANKTKVYSYGVSFFSIFTPIPDYSDIIIFGGIALAIDLSGSIYVVSKKPS